MVSSFRAPPPAGWRIHPALERLDRALTSSLVLHLSSKLKILILKVQGMPSLFDPIRFGAISSPNRIVMAPLTRGRADRNYVPTPVMAEYYAQRASAGLIISEATGI